MIGTRIPSNSVVNTPPIQNKNPQINKMLKTPSTIKLDSGDNKVTESKVQTKTGVVNNKAQKEQEIGVIPIAIHFFTFLEHRSNGFIKKI